MKFLVFPLVLFLVGCSSMQNDRMNSNKLLDAAPKGETEVRNPDWSVPPSNANSGVRGPLGQVRTSSYQALQQFLLHNRIDYEVLPGSHVMVRLKDSIQFETGSAQLSQASYYWLSVMSGFLSQQRGIDVVIDGHTDTVGQSMFNDSLSVRRADMVKNTLVKNNVSEGSIYTRGYGEYIPACSNRTTAGRACNRRVELLLIVLND
ncbi:OmpA family protein [Vibrio ziniensis]|uniref:OmpA family protein n=1 Tax=Vibrio ziniensis TaxID=2711221 RepID=A0A6G7CQM4_9VIBR|nr:OmpA family protein [Vibrio ziniensis]QIH44392.1 OmpA family protein [Vibrio ziniensis]